MELICHCKHCDSLMQVLPATIYCPVCDDLVKVAAALRSIKTSSFPTEKRDKSAWDDISRESNGETPDFL